MGFSYWEPVEMKISKEGLADIISYEGMTPTPYLDDYPGGTWTIGIGITASDGINVKAYLGKPPQSIETMVEQFRDRIQKYENGVNKAIKVDLTQQQFDALVGWHYNTGAISSSTLTKLINQGASESRIKEFWSNNYIKSNGHVMQGLIKRRKKEVETYFNGVYGDGMTTYVEANSKGKQLWSTAKEINILPYL